ncbi:MAG: DUF1616 domain-containing protein [Haloarculaceae archaeon]
MATHARWLRDLLAVVALSVLSGVVVLSGLDGSPLRTTLVAPLVVFLPGYALVAALYPHRYRAPEDASVAAGSHAVTPPTVGGPGLPPTARLGLSVAASVALVPAVAFLLDLLSSTIRVVPVLVALVGVTFVCASVAMVRRRGVDAADRFTAPSLGAATDLLRRYFHTGRRNYAPSSAYRATSRRDVLLNLAVVAGVLVFVGSAGFAFAAVTGGADATDASTFTELYLTTRTSDGDYVARDYPRRFGPDATPVYVTITNHEGGPRNYTVVVQLQRVDRSSNGTTVVERTRLGRFGRQVGDGETVRVASHPSTTRSGPDLRVRYLLYVGDPPADPNADTADRYVQLWLSGDSRGSGGTA